MERLGKHYAVTSCNNRRDVAGGILCGSAPRLYNENLTQLELEQIELSAMKLRMLTEAEDSLPGKV
jgi:hypothetical protein